MDVRDVEQLLATGAGNRSEVPDMQRIWTRSRRRRRLRFVPATAFAITLLAIVAAAVPALLRLQSENDHDVVEAAAEPTSQVLCDGEPSVHKSIYAGGTSFPSAREALASELRAQRTSLEPAQFVVASESEHAVTFSFTSEEGVVMARIAVERSETGWQVAGSGICASLHDENQDVAYGLYRPGKTLAEVALGGKLIASDGCVMIQSDADHVTMLAWPEGTSLTNEGDEVTITLPEGSSVKLGDDVDLGGGPIPRRDVFGSGGEPLPSECLDHPPFAIGQVNGKPVVVN